jgi:NAD(P)-dependent dehydrogenase (short-subunit alcohol dehydrogenase family)
MNGAAGTDAGRVALITGGASGIGYGIAVAAAQRGMRLALADVDPDALAQAQQRLQAMAAEVLTLRLDVSDAVAWRAAAEKVQRHYGAVHLLCNNAGITGTGHHVAELDPEEWQRILAVNLSGAFFGCQTLLPYLRRHGEGGHIVNTASMGALLPYAGGASYVASKAGMLAFSETLRQELDGSGIGVSVLLPGLVRTRLFETSAQVLAGGADDAMQRRAAAVTALAQQGLDALAVGRLVLAAVRAGRFHIYTHPELREALVQRQLAQRRDFEPLAD